MRRCRRLGSGGLLAERTIGVDVLDVDAVVADAIIGSGERRHSRGRLRVGAALEHGAAAMAIGLSKYPIWVMRNVSESYFIVSEICYGCH